MTETYQSVPEVSGDGEERMRTRMIDSFDFRHKFSLTKQTAKSVKRGPYLYQTRLPKNEGAKAKSPRGHRACAP